MSTYYTSPPQKYDEQVLNNLHKRVEYHKKWSHIRYILAIDSNFVGIILSDKSGEHNYLDLYDLELNRITGNILMPEYVGGPNGLMVDDDTLYLLKKNRLDDKGQLINPSIEKYKLIKK